MSQPVKLSDGLVLDARRVLELSRSGAARSLTESLQSVDSPAGRQRVAASLAAGPFPHYAPHADSVGLLVRTDESGRSTIGRFVNRRFEPVKIKRMR